MVGSRRVLSVLVAIVTVAAAACAKPAPIQIGFVTGLTGRHYDLGLSSRNGVELAVKELNAAGGVRGRPIELVIRDDGQDPEQARRAVTELVRSGVVAIIGHATSAMAEATLPIVNRERVLMVSPTVSSSQFKGQDDWFVMMHPSTADSARVLSEHLAARGKVRTVSAIYDVSNLAFTKSWHDAFKARFEASGGAVRSIPFTSGQGSTGELAAAALAGGADAVLLLANALDTAALAQQVRLRSPTAPILGAEWGFTSDVIVNGGRAVEGAIFVQKLNLTDESPRYRAFSEAYVARYGREVDFAAAFSYESVQLLAAALARDTTREGVRGAILGMGSFEGLQGTVKIDRFGDAERRHYVMTLRGGKVVPAE
jgi:branched-chain amino acid transport system substrate-binding protein